MMGIGATSVPGPQLRSDNYGTADLARMLMGGTYYGINRRSPINFERRHLFNPIAESVNLLAKAG